MPDRNYESMLKDLKALPKTKNPVKHAQRLLLFLELHRRIKITK